MQERKQSPPEKEESGSKIIPRSQHPLSRKMIDEDALKVLYRLHNHGYLAYLVGGSVRDLLLGRKPKDFDVATNARPHEIRSLFRNSRVIGRRFRLVHVFFKGGKVIEVSTFRSRSEFEELENGERAASGTERFGTPEEDARRRDITINGLFYNIADFTIIDFIGGLEDLRQGIVRTIGEPEERFKTDPVRMIRVIRHAARTGFAIENKTYQAILHYRDEIRKCSPSRLRDEFLRDLREGFSRQSLALMLETGLLLSLFPDLKRIFGEGNPGRQKASDQLLSLFGVVDELSKQGISIPDSTLLALFIRPFLESTTPEHPFLGEKERRIYRSQSIFWAMNQLLGHFSFQRATRETAVQILSAQENLRMSIFRGMAPKRLISKRYFQEAVLLYGIEARARGETVPHILRRAVSPFRLPWWPVEETRIRRRHGYRIPPNASEPMAGT